MKTRTAFTLVELLVVVAVIGILIALLLPAIQMARESARQVMCRNHMKQLALGLLNYANGNGEWLPATSPKSFGGVGSAAPLSWRVTALPFVEQQSLFDSIDRDIPPTEGTNQKALATLLPAMQCPSTPDYPLLHRGFKSRHFRNDLKAPCAGVSYVALRSAWNLGPQNGVRTQSWGNPPALWKPPGTPTLEPSLLYSSPLMSEPASLGDCVDGLSTTVLILERVNYQTHIHANAPRNAAPSSTWMTADETDTISFLADSQGNVTERFGVNHCNIHTPYSEHPSGAFLALGDGSVHLMNTSTDVKLLHSLYTRDSGDIPTGFAAP